MRVLSLDYNPEHDEFEGNDRRALRRIMSDRPMPAFDRIRPYVRTRNGNLVTPAAR